MPRAAAFAVCAALVTASCGDAADHGTAAVNEPEPHATTEPATAPEPPVTTEPATAPEPDPERAAREVRIRLDRRVDDAATAGFEEVVVATLSDPRGWARAGFELTVAGDAPYTIVLAEGDVVDELCQPYRTGGRFSCQNGPVVALNADRWREGTPQWTGDLHGYRQMLVNHEVGHLLGEHHPAEPCPGPGEPAPVMAQQSTNLGACTPNPWPLPWEVDCARDHPGPLAPGYEAEPSLRCGPGGPGGPGGGVEVSPGAVP